MQQLPDFRLLRPATYGEAAALLAAEPGARLLAGGTDLVANLRRGLESPPVLVDLGAVQGRADVAFDAGALVVGAGITLARLAADERLAGAYAAIGQAARAAAGPGPSTAIGRGVGVGDVLLSISAAGVAGNRLDDLTRTAWVGFGD